MGSQLNIIVKVGKTSHIKFRGVKAFRAVTFEEVLRISKNCNASIVIIESILPYETQGAELVISEMTNAGKEVFLYCQDGANIQEEEISEQYGINVVTNLSELHTEIKNRLHVNVSTAWGRAEEVVEEALERRKAVQNRGLSEAISAIDTQKVNEETHRNIQTKEDLMDALELEEISFDIAFNNEDDSEIEQTTIKHLDEDKGNTILELSKLLEAVKGERDDALTKVDKAYDTIQALTDIKQTLEADKNNLKSIVDSMESNANDKEVVEELNRELVFTKNKISELDIQNMKIEQSRVELMANKRQQESKIEELTQTIESVSSEVGRLSEKIQLKDAEIQRVNDRALEADKKNIELESLRRERDLLDTKVIQLQSKVTMLMAEVDSVNERTSQEDTDRISKLREETYKLEQEIGEINSRLNSELKAKVMLNIMFRESTSQVGELGRALELKNSEVEELRTESISLTDSLASTAKNLQQIKEEYNSMRDYSETIQSKLSSENKEIQEKSKGRVIELERELASKRVEIKDISSSLKETETRLHEKEVEVATMLVSTDSSTEKVKAAVGAKLALEESNEQMAKTIELLKKEISSVTTRLTMTEDANNRLEANTKKLKQNLTQLQAVNSTATGGAIAAPLQMGSMRLECAYDRIGRVIPVFGSGSFGITTTVMSLIRKIPKSKILVMDLDVVSPKIDGWLGKSPVIQDLSDISDSLKRTAFSALMEKGSTYIIERSSKVIQKVMETKSGSTIDYFSGVHTNSVDIRKLIATDFSEVMNYLGDRYDYIVVDLGKIGSSSVQDNLIKMFCGIAYKKVIISCNDKFDTRSLSLKIALNSISLKDTMWVLNIAESSKVDGIVITNIGKATPMIMPKVMEMYGQRQTYERYEFTRDKLNQLIEFVTGKEEN